MKKFKYMFWFILIVLLGVLVSQNLEFFASQHSLHINLGFYQSTTPNLPTGAIIAIFVGISVLLMMMFYFASRFEIYRAKKTVKELQVGMEKSADTIAKLTEEVEMLKGGGDVLAAPNDVETETDEQDEKVIAIEAETTETTNTTTNQA